MPVGIDESGPLILGDEFFQDPYPVYEALRAEGGARQARLPNGHKVWIVAGYKEARAALSDPRLSKRLSAAEHLFERHFTDPNRRWKYDNSVVEHMLNSDPPDHSRQRRLVGKAFTTRRVAALRPRIEQIGAELIDEMARHDEVDLIDSFAFPLPTTVICELLGIPEPDRDDFRSWSHTIVSVANANDPRKVQEDSAAMAAYLGKLLAAKRAHPADDLLTALVQATDDDDQLTEVELVSMAFLLLVAGHETTVNLISNGVLSLLQHPGQRALLRQDPGLVPNAVEELLRYEGPVNLTTLRYTKEPMTIGTTTVPEGEFVIVALSSANRDPRSFAGPDTLDVTRKPGGHVAFGHGIHYCVGAPLARLEAEVAFGQLVSRFPEMTLATGFDELAWRHSTLVRGLTALPVRLRP
ncbi:cytochrome P450 [Streptomyces sp. NPDC007991]|uniref:cytochrome P450 family protein n=1 Tax=Streptomyces sp. NPDC007991 TaxID=3364803 RepID=UPI0036EB1072